MTARWYGPLLWFVLTFSLSVAGVGVVRLVDAHLLANPGTVPTAGAMPPGAPSPTGPTTVEPNWLSLPALGVDAPVVPVSVQADGELNVPDDPTVLGWWRHGARPAARGTVVIDGHVDTRQSGAGAFFRLGKVKPGAMITLRTDSGTVAYEVRAVRHYAKTSLPADLFDTTGRARLVLISCGGSWDPTTHQYSENVVVYATPVGV